MEKRKLKKLKINRIKDEFPMIGGQEQMGIKGGQYWAPGYVANEVTVYGSYQNLLPEVTVYGRSFKVVETCSHCQAVSNSPTLNEGQKSAIYLMHDWGWHDSTIRDTIWNE